MTEPTQEQVEQLTRAIERFTRRFKVAEAAAAAENSLNALDVQTLVFVYDNPGCGVGDVARYLNVAMTTMSSAIDRLVKKALVERRRPEDNRRAVALTATDQGRQVVEDHAAGFQDACRLMLRSLEPAEQSELIRLTEKIADHETVCPGFILRSGEERSRPWQSSSTEWNILCQTTFGSRCSTCCESGLV